MNLNRNEPWTVLLGGLILGLSIVATTQQARANVYATNIRINDDTTNVTAAAGESFTISYLLNEPASLGTTIQLRSGSTVRSMDLLAEGQGTIRGFNSVTWDTSLSPVPGGTYSIAVIPHSSGYTNWTQITSDASDLNTYVFDGHGISVDRNPASPYYGRIVVANAAPGFNPNSTPGDSLGLLKFNADTSGAEEGIASADLDGHNWSGGDVSPWKLDVSADDFIYVDDLSNGGEVYRWDPTISSNSLLQVLRQDNQPSGAALSGPKIVGTGVNTQIWMGDTNQAHIYRWGVDNTFVCALNDTGALVVSGAGSNFFDVALDPLGNIYCCSYVTAGGDVSPKVFRFKASTGGTAETNADWAVGGNDDSYAGANSVAVDPTGTYLAVSFEGPISTSLFNTNGNTKILWATNGVVAANLDLGVAFQSDFNHDDTACAWDAVGNVYYIDNYFSRWRIFSPPGTNQASTLALPTLQITGGTTGGSPIQITGITVVGGTVNIDFSAGPNDTTSSFIIQGTASLTGNYSTVPGFNITQAGSGLFHATFPLTPSFQYFRITRTGIVSNPTTPEFTNIGTSGSNVVLTFSGSSSDSAASFKLWSSATVNGSYSQVATPNIVQLSPGLFQSTVPVTGPAQFYRVGK